MRKNSLLRSLTFMATFILTLLLYLVFVSAVNGEQNYGETSETNALSVEIGDSVYQASAAMEDVLSRYWNPVAVPANQIESFVSSMDEDTFIGALIDFEDTNFLLQDILDFESLNDDEKAALNISATDYDRFWFALTNRAQEEQLFETYAATGSIGGLSITSSNSSGNVTTGGDAAAGTGTATVSIKATGGVTSSKTAESTFTFKNTSGSTLQITFDYVIETATSYSINSVDSNTGARCTVKLEDQASFTVYLKAVGAAFFGSQTATCKITGLAVETVLDSAQLTVDYNSNFGVLKDAAGNTINANVPVTISAAGLTITATPAAGCNFVAWVEPATNKFISSSVTSEFSPTAGTMTAKAIFSDGVPWFIVNGDILVEGWDAAMAYGGTVVLANNATLVARTAAYNVPSTVNLLIPFSGAHVGVFGAIPESTAMASDAAPSCYRTLTVASGAVITVDGKLNVNGQRNVAKQGSTGTGTAKGGHGVIDLKGTGPQLTVNDGGVLTCYGFIKGSGSVVMNDGSMLYELLQVYDWGGGTNLSGWYGSLGRLKNQTLFFTSHYYLQNVEAPLTMNYGSALYGEAVLTVSGTQIRSSPQVVGTESTTNALFKMGSGTTLSRTYSPTTDRVEYNLHGSGTADLGALSVQVKVVFNVDLNSADFILPVNNAMTVHVGSGVTLSMGDQVALMPGAKMIIDEGAILNQSANLFIFDKDDKTSNLFYQGRLSPVYTASRGTSTKITSITESARLEVNGELNISGEGGIYTTNNGGTSSDKIIYGTGTIKHEGTTGNGAMRGGYTSSYVTVSTVDALANLAGIGDMISIGKATYHGLGADHNNYWYINSTTVDATCTEDAFTKYYCTDATKYYAVAQEGTAKGHTEVTDEAVAPTCSSTGLTEGKHCSVCSKVLQAQSTIPSLGHNFSSGTGECTVCGTNLAVAAVITDKTIYYQTLDDAIEYVGSGYVQMVVETTASVSVSAGTTVYIDLNGTTLTLTGLSGNVRFMDKSTDGYKDGNGRVIGAAVASLPAVTDFSLGGIERHYLKVDLGSNTYAFPRVAVAVTGIGYRSNSVGSYLTFQQTYRGNSLATGKLTDVGFGLDTTETWLGTANLSKIDQDQGTDGFTIRSHYDTAVPETLPNSVKALTKFNESGVVVPSLSPEALDLAYQAFGLKEAS